jgi:signal transduction histidine kinase
MGTREQAYFRKDLASLRVLGTASVLVEILTHHWDGELERAYELAGQAVAGRHAIPMPDRAAVQAEYALLSMKMGRELPDIDLHEVASDRTSLIVWHYARFSHYFFVDHHEAWRSLWRLLWLGLRTPASGMLSTSLFLMGHVLAVGGFSRLGDFVTRAVFTLWIEPRIWLYSPTPISEAIVFSAYPYTSVVCRRLDRLEETIRRCQARLNPDPYYMTIFYISALYGVAYVGDVTRTEIITSHLKRIHERGGLMRYRPVVRIMGLLPLALRGYSHLIENDFADVVESHDPEPYDALINSQFYRAAALIALAMGQHDAADRHIAEAIRHREESRSFHAWGRIDRAIQRLIGKREAFEPGTHNLFGRPLRFESSMSLGTLLFEAIRSLPATLSDGVAVFEDRIAGLVGSHLDCPEAELINEPASLSANVPQLRIGNRYLVLRGVPAARLDMVERFLGTISPAIRSLEQTVREILRLRDENERASKQSVIAQTTQMIAHDVRRPFSMLQMGLDSLKAARSPAELSRVAHALLPEIEESASQVTRLLEEILEIGNDAVHEEPVHIEQLIVRSLIETLHGAPGCAIELEYQLTHTHLLFGDSLKLQRVLSNLISNAVRAVNGAGRLWFRTAPAQDGFSRVTVGNAGSYIAPEDRSRIFDAFVTKDSPGGIGLGLAIAQKLIRSHGGRIWCESSRELGVEFHFTLRTTDNVRNRETECALPRDSREALERFPLPDSHATAPEFDRPLQLLLRESRDVALAPGDRAATPVQTTGSPTEIALVDDSRAFLTGWRASIGANAKLHFFASPDQFWLEGGAMLGARLSALITDYRFSNSEESGISFARLVRQRIPGVPVILSSSGVFTSRELAGVFDLVIDKRPTSWTDLRDRLRSTQVRQMQP